MNSCKLAASVLALLLPGLLWAQQAREDDVDEVIVIGHAITTGLARIDVDRAMVVDTASVLKDVPGANVNTNGPITGIAQYRGMFGDRISVAIDDMGVVGGCPNAMTPPLSDVSPMITSELSVTRGIPSVSLAPESIGGHVATELARGDFTSDRSSLSGFVGSRFSGNGNVSTSAGRLTFASPVHKVSLIAELDDGDDVDTPVGTMRPSRLYRERADLSYAYAGDQSSLMVFLGRLDTDETGTPALPMDIRFVDTGFAGIQAAFDLSDRFSVTARTAWNDVEHLMDNFGLRQAPMAMRQRESFTTGTGGEARIAASLKRDAWTMDFGLNASVAEHGAIITNPNNAMFRIENFVDVQRDVTSAFVEWTLPRERDDVELGLRVKRVAADAAEVGASGIMGDMGTNVAALADAFNAADRGLDWTTVDAVAKYRRRVSPRSEWRIEVGSKTRAPSYQELYLWLPLQATGGLADGRSYIGGLGLEEERSNEIALGIGNDFGRFTLSPEFFYRRVDGYIQGVPSSNMTANMVSQMMSGRPALEFANVDAEIWGADLAWKVQLSERWFLDGIASYVRGKRRDVDDNLYRLAPPNASVGLTRAITALSMTLEVVGYAKQDKVSSYNDEQGTPGYGLVNLAAVWTPWDALRLEARLDNALDKTYQDHVAGINRANGSDIPVGARLYGLERTLSVGAVFSF
ncbi:MAG: TonB-dependent receptor [Gammaproteobacteria bacterium]|nr:TonB-dependent receptor [Gammaproteobacteria bacterium]